MAKQDVPASATIVELARKAVDVPGLLSGLRAAPGGFYCLDRIGNSWVQPARPRIGRSPSAVALFAEVTTESVATRDALVRGLLQSRVVVEDALILRGGYRTARLTDVADIQSYSAIDAAQAVVDALLDALLGADAAARSVTL